MTSRVLSKFWPSDNNLLIQNDSYYEFALGNHSKYDD